MLVNLSINTENYQKDIDFHPLFQQVIILNLHLFVLVISPENDQDCFILCKQVTSFSPLCFEYL